MKRWGRFGGTYNETTCCFYAFERPYKKETATFVHKNSQVDSPAILLSVKVAAK